MVGFQPTVNDRIYNVLERDGRNFMSIYVHFIEHGFQPPMASLFYYILIFFNVASMQL